ncbi:MAG: hypothetical protein V4644_00140 [Patescibacteria group bacterium]
MPNASSEVLLQNLIRRIKDSSVYTELALKTKGNTAKSAHYRAAMMIVATIVEGLTIHVIRRWTREDNPIVLSFTEKKSMYHLVVIDQAFEGVHVIKEVPKTARLFDRQCTIEVMNKYCVDEGLLTKSEFNKLESVRKKRNSIHVQTLTEKDRGYTYDQLQKMEDVVDLLIRKLRYVVRNPKV